MSESQFLEDLFDEALERLQHGGNPTPESLCPGRPALREEVAEILRLARSLCPPRPWGPPSVPGYGILEELGRGGMGVVWLARQEAAGGRRVALKTLPSGLFAGGSARERLVRETRALSAARHPNVVVLFDVVETDSVLAYAMEWVEGATLAGAIQARARSGRMPPGTADRGQTWEVYVCGVGVQLARALGHLHGLGILHRDVKPSNVLLRLDGTPVLSDLGLASLPDASVHTHSGAFVGTPAYASPEQLRGAHAELDERSDVYSLGATLFHALTLGPLLTASSALEALDQLDRRGPLPRSAFPRGLSDDLYAVVATATDPEAGRRYASALDLALDLERVLELRPVRARPATWTYRLGRFVRRNRRSFWAAIAGSALVALVAAGLFAHAVVRPRYVAQRLEQARSLLLNPTHVEQDAVWRLRARGWEGVPSIPVAGNPEPLERYRASLALYERALRWTGERRPGLERDAVGLALDLLTGSAPRLPPSLAQGPAADFVARWRADAWEPVLEAPALEGVDPEILRTTGLVAYLCGFASDCDAAWRSLPMTPGEDPFIDGTFGAILQHQGEPELAYPRLLSASKAFPEHGYLLIQVADAALMVGDVEAARQFLARSEGRGSDPYEHRELVEADLALMSGDFVEASKRYLRCSSRHKNQRSRVHGALAAFLAGQEREALYQAAGIALLPRAGRIQFEQARWLANRWWLSLGPSARIDHVVASWATPLEQSPPLLYVLTTLSRAPAPQPDPAWYLPGQHAHGWLAQLEQVLPPVADRGASPPLEGLWATRALMTSKGLSLPSRWRRALASACLALDWLRWEVAADPTTSDACPLIAPPRPGP